MSLLPRTLEVVGSGGYPVRPSGGPSLHTSSASRRTLSITWGALFSQRVLLALVQSGMQRDEAYRIVQQAAQHAWDERIALRELLAQRPDLGLDLDAIFDLGDATRWAADIVGRLDALETSDA